MRLALALLLMSAPLALRADEATDAAGEQHLARAQQAIDLNAWATALAEFEAASNVMSHDELSYELARCFAHLGREAEAIARYEQLATHPGPMSAAARARLGELDLVVFERAHPQRGLAAPLVTGVGAVLLAGVGAVLVGSAIAPLSGLDAIDCPSPCGTRRSLAQRADIGYGFFAAAGVAAIVDAFLWVRWKHAHDGPSPRRWDGLRF